MTPLLGMFGFLEVVVYAAVAAIVLPSLLTRFPARQGPRCLGVCWRLARRQGLPVLPVRILAIAAIVLSGIGPGVCVYLLLGCVLTAHQDRF
jgi:phage shock protein PspC (stress-responsive transcriptional regulator)